jgi:mono/diheme cytochrome c family protein
MRISSLALAVSLTLALPACDDDDDTGSPDAGMVVGGGGGGGAGGGAGGTGGGGGAAGGGGAPAGVDGGAGDAGGPVLSTAATRGRYLANSVFGCAGCHTPRGAMGLDMTKLFGGNDCFRDFDTMDAEKGCIASANLTPHETGIKNRTDQELKDMFLKGERPDGKLLFGLHNGSAIMPYHLLANMTSADADAIVAYLRSLTPVDHQVKASQPPFDTRPTMAVQTVKLTDTTAFPEVPAAAANADSARRGRSLAAIVCVECHSPAAAAGTLAGFDATKTFQGGRMFGPVMGMNVASANLTPDDTGLKGWTTDDIVKVLKMGTDKMGKRVCSPMPSYPNMTDDDAKDIANYLLALPAKQNPVAAMCAL